MIFDFDGTLVDTSYELTALMASVLRDYGKEPASREEVMRALGDGPRKLMEWILKLRAIDPSELDTALDLYLTRYEKSSPKVRDIYPGIMETLSTLRARGVKCAINTNKPEDIAIRVAGELFPGLFDLVVGDRADKKRKPSGDGVREILRALEIRPEDAFYIGDTAVDIATARDANVPVIAASWGFRTREELEREHPDRVIDHPRELF